MGDLILQLIIIFPIFYFTQYYKSIILLSFVIDSLFSAIYFIKFFILNESSHQELLTYINKLYKVDLINRYIYYLTLEIFYIIICNLFWNTNIIFLYYFLLLTICPEILNYICHNYLYKYINFIDIEKKKFMKVIICKQLASVINTLSMICIDKNSEINFNELLFLFDDYDKTVGDFLIFFKNFLIISLIHYARKKSNTIYSTLITYFYNYKTGELIESIDLETAKKRFSKVIFRREWKKLLSTEILQSIIYIYSLQNNSKIDYITIHVTKFNYTLIKMFTIWSIGSFIDKPYLLSLLSLFFLIYRKPFKIYFEKDSLYKYTFRLLASLIGIFFKNYFFLSFICEFGYAFTFNKIMNTIVLYIYHKFEKILHICIHFNKYNIFLITIFIYIEVIKFINQQFFIPYEYHILNYIFYLININNNYKRIVINLIIFVGILSNYDEYHIIYILGISYLCINIDNYFSNNRDLALSILKKKININIIESYYKTRNNKVDNNKNQKKENIYIGNIDNKKIDSSINPTAPLIFDEKYISEDNIKIYDKDINLMESYRINHNTFNQKD